MDFTKKINFSKITKLEIIAFVIIVIVNYILKIPVILKGYFGFTYDQGRDFLQVAKIVYQHDLILIGQTTGLQGVFYGPWWYYFLSPIFFISSGDPQKVAIFFAVFGIITVISIYLLLRYLTNSIFLSLSLTLIASMSINWMFGPTSIWNPSLVPILMVVFILLSIKIFNKPKPLYFFILGLTIILITDSSAAFGVMLVLFTLLTPLLFKKVFFRIAFLYTFCGGIIILLPRIIFELRNNFLITRALITNFIDLNYYVGEMPIIMRLISRLDHFIGLFSDSFAGGNKIIGVIILLILIVTTLLYARLKNNRKLLFTDPILLYLLYLVIILLIGFILFPGIVWNYYLVGLPVIFLILISQILLKTYNNKQFRLLTIIYIIILMIINFNKGLLPPYKISWEGDDSTYRNEKMVIDYISQQNPQNYSIYAYSTARFDYPFDYLIYWYQKRGLISSPKDNQRLMYLIIRDDENHSYFDLGWYGDKTKGNTTILEKKEFPGDLILEKHITNEKI